MTYIAKKKKNRRTLNTGNALVSMFNGRQRKPCAYCNALLTLENATFDHVIALSNGGYDKRKNGVIACLSCNRRKGSMSADQYKQLLKKESK